MATKKAPSAATSSVAAERCFPPGFMLGAATAAYQVEGGWNADGKGENSWDRITHTHPELVTDGSNGDIACDSYHRYKEDVKAIKEMGPPAVILDDPYPSAHEIYVILAYPWFFLHDSTSVTSRIVDFDRPEQNQCLLSEGFIEQILLDPKKTFSQIKKKTEFILIAPFSNYNDNLQMDFYRFSISWARILPDGTASNVNEKGIDYYRTMMTELLDNGIQPMVTMFHWDLPQPLQEMGGWMNPLMADFFEDYARVLFSQFGDLVKWWITFNEPGHTARSYTTNFIILPFYELRKQGANYLAIDTILKAHARVYHMYDKEFRPCQGGKVGITMHTYWYEPPNDTEEAREACSVAIQFDLGIFTHPIFSKTGDYPEVVKRKVAAASLAEGWRKSRLPELSQEWIRKIKNTADFFGLNHYTTYYAELSENSHWWLHDSGVHLSQDPKWPAATSSWLRIAPWGLNKLLNWIKNEYDYPPVMITENGFSTTGEEGLHDTQRINYFIKYLNAVLDSVDDGCNILGYTVWSVLDNFEWARGYSEKFGLYQVDFSHPHRTRTPRDSAKLIKDICHSRKIVAISSKQ